MRMTSLIRELSLIPGAGLEPEGDLSRITGFRTGGKAVVCTPEGPEAFAAVMREVAENGAPYRVLGNGTNTFALDEGYDGVVIRTRDAFRGVSAEGDTVSAGAGASLAEACRAALDASLTGLEFAYGIPGTLGGAVYMNAGAYGGEMKDVLRSVTVYDCGTGFFREMDASELDLSYRHSLLHDRRDLIVTRALLQLRPGDREEIRAAMDDLMGRRLAKQPLEYPSCGSTFKRPEGAYAAKLIEDCGLKGYTVGGAQVSEKHSGFVINRGGATSGDVLAVVEHVRETVLRETGYLLECEIEVLE